MESVCVSLSAEVSLDFVAALLYPYPCDVAGFSSVATGVGSEALLLLILLGRGTSLFEGGNLTPTWSADSPSSDGDFVTTLAA